MKGSTIQHCMEILILKRAVATKGEVEDTIVYNLNHRPVISSMIVD